MQLFGNPPFLGGKHMRLNLGDEYVDKVFKQFPDIKDVDFCSYWFRLAHNNICRGGSQTAPTAGRIGLVATNSISQGKSRKATLDYIANKGGYIHEAISTQPWSGEAKVHVSIVNWSYEQPKQYFLDDREVNIINSSLQANIDVSNAKTLQANLNQCFQGIIPNGKGFVITEQEANQWIKNNSINKKVLKLFSMGANLAQNPCGKPDRWIIDFDDMSIEEASDFEQPFDRVKSTIPIERQNNRNKKLQENWWQYEGKRLSMRKAIAPLSYYFTVPRVSKWAIFIPAPINWLPGDKSVVVTSEDFYLLGILTSKVHRSWMEAQKSTLKADIAYTHKTCFETFPFPQNPGAGASRRGVSGRGERPFAPTEQIRNKTIELHQYRTEQMSKKQWGITQ
ncbi:MAG: hypothetical protein RLZZ574_1783, partial [Cyanobacteriota bacterium]